jgi:small subunit ribosomal protein S8
MCQWFNSTFGQILKIFKAFMSNTLIKFLIKLKNAALSKQESVSFDFNTLNLNITEFLYNEGLIQSFFLHDEVILNKSTLKICITLRAIYNKPLLKSLKIISTPVKMTYLTFKNLSKLPSTKTLLVLSTSKGFLTGLACKKQKLGGVLLFTI